MLTPCVGSRVEQWRELVGLRIDGGEIRSLAEIAAPARQSQILRLLASAVLPSANMLNVKSGPRQCILWNAAILASPLRSLPHKLADRFIHR
jgi:hypothetical protein